MTCLHLSKNVSLSENTDPIQISSVSEHRNETQISLAWYLITAPVEEIRMDVCERVEIKGEMGNLDIVCRNKSMNGDTNG